jgi:hypothetical protein
MSRDSTSRLFQACTQSCENAAAAGIGINPPGPAYLRRSLGILPHAAEGSL